MQPAVTAVVSSYNHDRYVEEAVRSVLSQNLDRPYEILVIDDGSTDGSRKILERLAREDTRIRLVVQRNRGISATFNLGLELSDAQWVAYCGSDDRWHAGHLRALLEAAEACPEAVACFGAARVVDADGSPQVDARLFRSYATHDGLLHRLLYDGNFLCFTAALLRRKRVLDAGGFDVQLGVLQDYDLWLKLLQEGLVTGTADPTVDFRWHGANASGPASGLQKRLDHVRILERALDEIPLLKRDASLRARVHKRLASAHRRISRRIVDWPSRLHHLREARRHGGSWWQLGGELLRRPAPGELVGMGVDSIAEPRTLETR